MQSTLVAAVAVSAITVSLLAFGHASAGDPVEEFLSSHFRLAQGNWRDLPRRRPVLRSLETSDDREIATLGVIPIQVLADFYVNQLRDIVQFKRGEAVLQLGRFGNPARLEDVAPLTLEHDDVEDLRRCGLGSCDVQLSRDAFSRFASEVAWGTPAAAHAANRLFREVLVDLVNRYRMQGDSALMIYAAERQPLSLTEEFRAMIGSPPAILRRFPTVHQHLVRFPHGGAAGVDDLFYWSKEQFGPATISSVTHMVMLPWPTIHRSPSRRRPSRFTARIASTLPWG